MIDPDAGIREDDIETIVLRMMAKYQPPVNVNNGNGAFHKWITVVVSGLIIAGIPGLIGMELYNSGRLAALEANVTWLMTHDHKQQ